MTFEDLNLNNPLLNAIAEMGYTEPTPIQARAFPVILSGKDVVGIAQTGTGKTLAYLLPMLRQLPFSAQKHPRILIVVPTRELVVQICNEIEKLTKYTNLRYLGIFGGTNINTQKLNVAKGTDILVATPGRLVDIALSGVLRFNSVQQLVIDEIDEMLDLGFRTQIVNLLDSLPEKRQNLMFSASLTNDVEELINEFVDNPEKIFISASGETLDNIEQVAYSVPNFYTKTNFLEYLLTTNREMRKVLVFVDSKRKADLLGQLLEPKFPGKTGVIHSNKSQNLRLNTLKRFQDGESRLLIATDIAGRGLDILDITHVVNFDVPEVAEDYIHRIGRTGRAKKDGISYTFISDKEQERKIAIELLIKKEFEELPMPEEVAISIFLTDEEKPKFLGDKDYLKLRSKAKGGAHEKKGKNQKVNFGGPKKTNPRKTKPTNRNSKANRAKKYS